MDVIVDRDVGVGGFRCRNRIGSCTGHPLPAAALALKQRHRAGSEGLPHLVQQQRERLVASQYSCGELTEQGGLRPRSGSLLTASSRLIDHQRHHHRNQHHDRERDHVLVVSDREGVQRWREEEVEQQPGRDGGQQSGAQSADQRDHDHCQDEQHHVSGQPEQALAGHRDQRCQPRQRQAEQPAQQRAAARKPSARGCHQPGTHQPIVVPTRSEGAAPSQPCSATPR